MFERLKAKAFRFGEKLESRVADLDPQAAEDFKREHPRPTPPPERA